MSSVLRRFFMKYPEAFSNFDAKAFYSLVDGAAEDFKAIVSGSIYQAVVETTGYHASSQLFLALGAPPSNALTFKTSSDFELDSFPGF